MVLYAAVSLATAASAKEKTKTSFCDPEDGAFDVSSFLDQPFGFIPTVVPVTEPAVGAGAAIVPVFINLPENGEGKPDIWGVGGMRTSNGSEALFAGHSGYWMDGRLHTLVGGVDGSINLDFHGLGQNLELSGQPLTYNIDMTGGMVAGYWALDCEKRWNLGLEYTYAEVNLSVPDLASNFRVRGDPTGQHFGLDIGQRRDAHGFSSEIGSVGLNLSYDSRNNIFTPTEGLYSGLIVTFNSEAFGGSSEFQRYQWTNLYYTPLFTDKLILGVKADLQSSSGDVPIYMRPYVQLRGAPAMRYQGAHVAYAETELRWQFTDRWSVLGFGGIGATWSERRFLSDNDTTWTGGLGLRYLLARKYGLHMGLDVAYGEEGPACYLQFGSAWFKP
ncbi:BamA/TamA family outer membrane protein [Haloferula sp. BvORR071]|uniref:BamA/TamA family outer membrane protein n=1 Tax=Haloferula sp. BvORR071 TaxID=1396141 RepID=UPI0006985187|nr:BamA/TamA family outer membrane protein [Haloferula sp. BvORR071]